MDDYTSISGSSSFGQRLPSLAERETMDRRSFASDEDLKKMAFMNHEVEVKMYKDKVSREIRNFRVTHVISPFHFFTELDAELRCGNFNHWYDAMQAFYNDPELSDKFRIITSVIYKFRCYVCLDEETQQWERVRVFKANLKGDRTEVFFLDKPQYRVVRTDYLMEMSPQFSRYAAMGFPTNLLHIRPVGGGTVWPKKAVDYFRSLVQGRVFRTLICSRTEVDMREDFRDQLVYISVALIRRDPLADCTVQAEMVKAGYAEATGVWAGYKEVFDRPNLIPHFSMEEFEMAEREELFTNDGVEDPLLTDPEQIETAVQGMFKATQERMDAHRRNVQEILNEKRKRQLKEFKSLEDNMYTLNLIPQDVLAGTDQLPTFLQERIGYVKFSHMSGPNCGFVQMLGRVSQLYDMEAAISSVVENQPEVPSSECRTGVAVATLLQEDKDREPMWVRAVIKHKLPTGKLLRVILVDYGNEIAVKCTFTRYLPDYFKQFPSFAHRIHLDVEDVIPSGGGKTWGMDIRDAFRKYVCSWETELPLYYVFKPPQSKIFELEDYSQEIQFDMSTSKWVMNPPKEVPANENLNNLKDTNLLNNIFTSHGVEVVYEVLVFDGKVYQFDGLADVLVQRGYATQSGPREKEEKIQAEFVRDFLSQSKIIEKQRNVNMGNRRAPSPTPSDSHLSTFTTSNSIETMG